MNGIELFPAMRISSTGLQAERVRMEIAANNMANAHSTRGEDGQLYQRRQVVFSAVMDDQAGREPQLGGVRVEAVVADNRPPVETYAPHHPHADANGMVQAPDISPIEEMLDMITATRAYEGNLTALRQSRDMARATITLGRPQ